MRPLLAGEHLVVLKHFFFIPLICPPPQPDISPAVYKPTQTPLEELYIPLMWEFEVSS